MVFSFYGAAQEAEYRKKSSFSVAADETGQGNRLQKNFLGMKNSARAPEPTRFAATSYSGLPRVWSVAQWRNSSTHTYLESRPPHVSPPRHLDRTCSSSKTGRGTPRRLASQRPCSTIFRLLGGQTSRPRSASLWRHFGLRDSDCAGPSGGQRQSLILHPNETETEREDGGKQTL